jgi:hypothetical protein
MTLLQVERAMEELLAADLVHAGIAAALTRRHNR